jgi:F-box interacting protein
MEDIFARLPGKYAQRCRCLSRGWAATLASDDFVDLHLRLSNRQGGPRILLLQDRRWCDGRPPVLQTCSPDHPVSTTTMDVPRALTRVRCPFPLPAFRGINAPYRAPANIAPRLVTQQCRGLVVLEAAAARTHHVFNPSTGQMAVLPEGRPTARGVADAKASHSYASLALGYDTSTKKHKVVRIYYRGCGVDTRPWLAGCEVYVINSGAGLWRPVEGGDQGKPPGWVNANETSVFAQGHVHWLAKPRLNSWREEMFVVSFSLDNEKFQILPLPSPVDGKNFYELKVYSTDIGGHLCLFCSESLYTPTCYDIWVLREHETVTWDLRHRINLAPKIIAFMRPGGGIRPLAIADNGRRIVLIQPWFLSYIPDFRMCIYSAGTGQMEDLSSVADDSMIFRHAAAYEESVASPGKPHEDIIFPMSLVLLRQETTHKALARLKCVCRSWRTMIESDDFRDTRRWLL